MKGDGKQKICDALCALAAERPVSKVTISDLIATAGVNRSTFYYHFDSTQDVLDQMTADFCRQYLKLLSMPPGKNAINIEAASQMRLEQEVCGYVTSMERYIRFFLAEENYHSFKRNFFLHFNEYCNNHRVVELCPDGQVKPLKQGIAYDYYLRILFAQLLGILEYWAERDFSEGPDDFIQIINTLNTANITLQG